MPVTLPAFQIDRLPYPNDPAEPPRTHVSRREAANLCEAEGKRLCTELEWERACKGDGDRAYAWGDAPRDIATCEEDPAKCASPFGVAGMATIREWTASAPNRTLGNATYSVLVRGAFAGDEGHYLRCASRRADAPESTRAELGFRCCRGPEPEATYPEERHAPRFRDVEMDTNEVRAVLAAVPELASFAEHFEPMGPDHALRALAAGGKTQADLYGWELTQHVLRWAPVSGEEAWVFRGHVPKGSLLAVVFPMPDGTFVHGGSFLLEEPEDAPPLALAYTPGNMEQLLWGAAWGRDGESGAILYKDDGTIVIVGY